MDYMTYFLSAVATLAGVVVKLYYVQQARDQELRELIAKSSTQDGQLQSVLAENKRLTTRLARLQDETIELGLALLDREGRIQFWASPLREMLGWAVDDVLGRRIDEAFGQSETGDEHTVRIERYAQVHPDGRPICRVLIAQAKSGEKVPLSVTIGAIDPCSEKTQFYLIFRRVE